MDAYRKWAAARARHETSFKRRQQRDADAPILAAIERHRLASAALNAAMLAGQSEERIEVTVDAEVRAFWGLVEVYPKTAESAWALCDYLSEYASREEQVCERRDYQPRRGWRFLPRLLENLRDAIERIERGNP
jgi:hypothetical protein